MAIKIALAGNPNCGKTTLFNDLTGSDQYVGNWPGVTVEKKDGVLAGHKDVIVQDLPGIYSLSPYSLEEVVARNYLVNEKPDAILNIIDGSNLERNLYLTTQLLEIGLPMVVAVNMIDVVRKNGDRLDAAKLSRKLGCPVVEMSALTGEGSKEAATLALETARKWRMENEESRTEGTGGTRTLDAPHVFSGSVEHALAHIEESLHGAVENATSRWAAIKVFERDTKAIEMLKVPADILAHVEDHIKDCEKEMEDDAESIITAQRYEYIGKIAGETFKRSARRASRTFSDKIDRIVTHRILALPIFILSLCAMWWLAVAEGGPGTRLTDWANDEFLGDGWHLPFTTHEVDGMDYEAAKERFAKADATVKAWEDGKKKAFVEDDETGEVSEEWEIDEAAYTAAKEVKAPDPSKYGVWVPGIGALIGTGLEKLGAGETVSSLVKDGAWGGVKTVLGFVPVITIVFLFLAFLEDCGYMARVALIMDRIFRKFGLSGKSFIPMIVGKGCGVPAVMAARTIESERDRRMTIILSTFIPCGAKTVIIAMFAAVFFREMWYVAPLMDVIAIAIVMLGGIALKKSRAFAGEAAPFVMELPAYHMPTLRGVLIHTWNRVKGYVLKAGLIIFPACVFLWFIMHFDWGFNLLGDEEIEKSMLHDMGSWIAWFFAPLGFGTWQGAAASVSAEIAKEQATATLGLVAANMDGATTAAHISNLFASMSDFPRLAALSFMLFNLFVPPCMVAIAVTFREMGSKAWGWFAVGFQLLVGYTLALSAYQIGMLCAGGGFRCWTAVAILVDLWCVWMVVRPGKCRM